VEATDRVAVLLRQNFGVRLGDESADVPLHRLNIDSLALEELLALIEDECAVSLADVTVTSRDTVATLMDVVRRKAASQ
jgi:acyl carrier protein